MILTHLLRGNHVMRTRGSSSSEPMAHGSPSVPSSVPLFAQGQRRWVVDEPKQDGFTALHLAMANKYVEIVILLLKAGAKVNVQTSETGSTPLHLALEEGGYKVAKALLQNCPTDPARGILPDLADANGNTALHKCLQGYSEAHKSRKASISYAKRKSTSKGDEEDDIADDSDNAIDGDDDGDSAGQRALRDCAFIALWLVQFGASIRAVNRRGKTPLDYCSDATFIEILVKRAAKRNESRSSVSRQGSTSAATRDVPSRTSVSNAVFAVAGSSRKQSAIPTDVTPTPALNDGRRSSTSTLRKTSTSHQSPVPPPEHSPLAARKSVATRQSRTSVSASVQVQDSGRERKNSALPQAELDRRPSRMNYVDSVNTASSNPHQLPRMSISDVLDGKQTLGRSSSIAPISPVPASVLANPHQVLAPVVSTSGHTRKSSTSHAAMQHRGHQRTDSEDLAEERDRFQQMLLESREESLCPLCKARPRRIAFVPCGHYYCQPCADTLNRCPSCRREVTKDDKLELYR